MTGLKTLSSKWPDAPAMVSVVSLPNTRVQTMVSASAWVGFTLPGMIELPGSFSGSASSPSPERGPLPKKRMSLAILNRAAAVVLIAPWLNTMASWAARASNLLGAVTKGRLGDRRDPLGHRFRKADRRVQPGADGGAPLRQLVEAVQRSP